MSKNIADEKLNIHKSTSNGKAIIKWRYCKNSWNYVGIKQGCAIKTKKGLCIIGEVAKIQTNYVMINTMERGKVKVFYNTITGIFPCSIRKQD